MNAGELPQEIRYTIDLKDNLVQRTMRGKLVKNDRAANKVVVVIVDGKEEVDLSGVTVTGGFVRPGDSAEILLSGSADGNVASVTLEDACYERAGTIEIFIRLSLGGITRTILTLTGDVIPKGSGAYVDITGAIPSVEDVIAQYAEMQAVTQRTLAAAQRAENLAIDANGLAGDANRLGGKPPEYYIQLGNQLDNSDFEVAQAGYNGLHGNELYHADRWFGNGSGTLAVSGGVKTFTSTSGFAFMRQTLWNDGRDHGKTYTLVITLPDGTRLAGSGKSPSAPSTSEQVFIDITAPDSKCWFMVMKGENDVMFVRVDASKTGSAVSFISLDLFEGEYTTESAPPHAPKGYAVELAECRRYYRELKYLRIRPYYVSEAVRYYRINIEPPMRPHANPTIDIIDVGETPLNSWADTGAQAALHRILY